MMRRSYNGKTPYSLQLNIKDMDLVANCPDPVRIPELEIMASHSHHTDRANSTGGGGGGCGMASKATCFG